jgi:hypothetical protein
MSLEELFSLTACRATAVCICPWAGALWSLDPTSGTPLLWFRSRRFHCLYSLLEQVRFQKVPARLESSYVAVVPPQRNYELLHELKAYEEALIRPLGDLAFALSGNKGGNANVGFRVRDAAAHPWLQSLNNAKTDRTAWRRLERRIGGGAMRV